MSGYRVSRTAKEVIVEALCKWADRPETISDARPGDLLQVVDTLIDGLDSAGFAIEIKAPMNGEATATDIGYQAIKVRRAEAAVRHWLDEQAKSGHVARADHAPGWRDYQQAYDNFRSAVSQAEATSSPLRQSPMTVGNPT